LRPSPQLLVGQIEAKGIEDYAFFIPHCGHRTLPKFYGRLMTCLRGQTILRA
jgi:tRNA isopentenyl-2-thiomethyl-A-37 hydroxylase MiaE